MLVVAVVAAVAAVAAVVVAVTISAPRLETLGLLVVLGVMLAAVGLVLEEPGGLEKRLQALELLGVPGLLGRPEIRGLLETLGHRHLQYLEHSLVALVVMVGLGGLEGLAVAVVTLALGAIMDKQVTVHLRVTEVVVMALETLEQASSILRAAVEVPGVVIAVFSKAVGVLEVLRGTPDVQYL